MTTLIEIARDEQPECRQWHLHMGVRPMLMNHLFRGVSTLKGYVREDTGQRYGQFLPISHASTDGDGWRCWGESVGDDVNDDLTIHVIVEIEGSLEDARAYATAILSTVRPTLHVDAAEDFPADQEHRSSEGLLAVLSTKSTWSAQPYLWHVVDGRLAEQHLDTWATEWDQ